jgi:hypothetical protein
MRTRLPLALLFATVLTLGLTSQAKAVDIEQWLDLVENSLPDLLCEQSAYFRQCFEIDDAQCRSTLSSTFQDCLTIYLDHLPEQINTSADGAHWGQLLGSCAGTKFEMQLTELKIQNARCNDITQWQ